MSDERSPRTRPLTWVSLGLLAVSWLIFSATLRFAASGQLLTSPLKDYETHLFWLFISGPYLLLGSALWWGGRDVVISETVFACAIFGVIISLLLAAAAFLGGSTRNDQSTLACILGILSLIAWPLGLWNLVRAIRQQRRLPPEGDE